MQLIRHFLVASTGREGRVRFSREFLDDVRDNRTPPGSRYSQELHAKLTDALREVIESNGLISFSEKALKYKLLRRKNTWAAVLSESLASYRPDARSDRWTSLQSERLMKICYAGAAAERIAFGSVIWAGCEDDSKLAAEIAYRECGSEDEVDALCRLMKIRATQTLLQIFNWVAVEQIATALLEDGTLRYKTVELIAGEAMTAVVKCKKCGDDALEVDPAGGGAPFGDAMFSVVYKFRLLFLEDMLATILATSFIARPFSA